MLAAPSSSHLRLGAHQASPQQRGATPGPSLVPRLTGRCPRWLPVLPRRQASEIYRYVACTVFRQAPAASFLAPARVFVASYSSTTLEGGYTHYAALDKGDMPRSLHYDRSAPHACHWDTGCTKRFSSKRQLFLWERSMGFNRTRRRGASARRGWGRAPAAANLAPL